MPLCYSSYCGAYSSLLFSISLLQLPQIDLYTPFQYTPIVPFASFIEALVTFSYCLYICLSMRLSFLRGGVTTLLVIQSSSSAKPKYLVCHISAICGMNKLHLYYRSGNCMFLLIISLYGRSGNNDFLRMKQIQIPEMNEPVFRPQAYLGILNICLIH